MPRTARRPCARSLEEVQHHAAGPGRARPVRALDHAARGVDPLRHLLLPRRSRPTAPRRSRTGRDRRRALVRAGARARGLRGRRAADGLPDDQEPRGARALRHRRRAARVGVDARGHVPSSPASRARARRRGSCSTSMSDRLTVAVTGPDGRDRPLVPARARPRTATSRGSSAWRGGRSTRRAREGRVPPGRRARPRRRRRARDARPTCSSTSRSSSWAAARRRARSTSTGSRNVFAAAARHVQAARLHLVGRRLRLPRRQPAAADRGRPPARQRALLLLGPEGRARAGARGGDRGHGVETYVLRPCIVAGPDAPAAAAPAPAAAPLPLPDPGTPFQLVHHDDVATRAGRRHARRTARPAPTTSPARARSRSRRPGQARSAASPSRCRGSCSAPRRWAPASRSCRARAVGQRRPGAGRDGHGEGAARAAAGGRATARARPWASWSRRRRRADCAGRCRRRARSARRRR